MRTLIVQHTPDENPGTLLPWLEQARYPFYIYHSYREDKAPTLAAYDWLIVLGGPMNVNDVEAHPWLVREKEFIRAWLAEKKPYLGICLGGQLLAQALGGEVTKNTTREIGFHSVERTGSDHPALRRWPNRQPAFHWHEDRFSLPEGCKSLLTNETCLHQAFARDHRTLGFQFHPESTEAWIRESYEGLHIADGETKVDSLATTEGRLPQDLPAMTKTFFAFLDDFTQAASFEAL